MVKLRLMRMGRRNRAYYRVHAVDERNPRNGRTLETLGAYDPAGVTGDQPVKLNAERIRYWLSRGAVPTPTVRSLLKKCGISGS